MLLLYCVDQSLCRLTRWGKQPVHPITAQHNKITADTADRLAIIFAEVGDRLEVRRQAARQPHQFHIALALHLKAEARLDTVQITVNVNLQQRRRMIAGSAGHFRNNTAKTKTAKIKFIDEDINHTNWVVLANPILKPLRE